MSNPQNHEKTKAAREVSLLAVGADERVASEGVASEGVAPETVSRREFLTVSAALSALAIGGCALGAATLGGCGTMGNQSSTGSSGTAPEIVLATAITSKMFSVAGGGQLSEGQAMLFNLPNGGSAGVLLLSNGKLRALSAKCPHAGCIVAWQKTQFHCPCHGSNFNANGKVLNGPAKTSLSQWTVSAQGNDAIVTT